MTGFKTPRYDGAWIPYDGDRMGFRLLAETFLRVHLSDPVGKLSVGVNGPEWVGEEKVVGLSYSHSGEWGILVFSRSHTVGVDLEREDRVLKKNYLTLAKRFFHHDEYLSLMGESVFDGASRFLELWMKKEAYSKLLRKHLVETINIDVCSVAASGGAIFEPLAKTRVGYRVIVALR